MTAKEYLSELENHSTRLKQKEEQKQMLLAVATSVTQRMSLTKIQSSSPVDRVGDTASKLADLEAEIDRDITDFWYKQDLFINQIQMLSDAIQMQVLFKTYVQFKALKTVAHEIGRSYQYTRELHQKALIAFEKIHADVLLCERKVG